MFTSYDKAITAIIMGGLYMLNSIAGIDIGISEETVTGILGVLTPLLVWLIPNKS